MTSRRTKRMEPVENALKLRRLIVNADDFGCSEEVNEAIIRAYNEGVLTSTSLMVTGSAFDHAVRLASENPGLGVGIHLVTVMGRCVLPPSEIPSLVDLQGNFSDSPMKALLSQVLISTFGSMSTPNSLSTFLGSRAARARNEGSLYQ